MCLTGCINLLKYTPYLYIYIYIYIYTASSCSSLSSPLNQLSRYQRINISMNHMKEHGYTWRITFDLRSADCRRLLRRQHRKKIDKRPLNTETPVRTFCRIIPLVKMSLGTAKNRTHEVADFIPENSIILKVD